MVRVIVNGVSFYTTKKKLVDGVGSDSNINAAVSTVYSMLKKEHRGIGTRITVYDNKMVARSFDVQIDL